MTETETTAPETTTDDDRTIDHIRAAYRGRDTPGIEESLRLLRHVDDDIDFHLCFADEAVADGDVERAFCGQRITSLRKFGTPVDGVSEAAIAISWLYERRAVCDDCRTRFIDHLWAKHADARDADDDGEEETDAAGDDR